MTVRAGSESEFVRLCHELTAVVREREPFVLWFDFFRLREPRRYCVVESFASEADEHRHMTTPHLAEYAPRIAACVEGTWVREYLDPLDESGRE
jgi:quinol monooxygenase YgiN